VEKYLESDRPQIIIWRMGISCWIPKATTTHARAHTHTQREYVILIAFPLQQWVHEHASF